MTPKSLPKKYDKAWGDWPTLDVLRSQNPDLKQHQIRALLKPVICYRCPDSSVRYLPESVGEALLTLPGDDDDDEPSSGDPLDAIVDLPKAYDVLILMRECMRMLGDARKHGNDTYKVMADTIKAMERPMSMGLDLTLKMTEVMGTRLAHYDDIWDRMMKTTEGLITDTAQREIEAMREKGKQELKQQTLGLAASYLPTLLQGLGTSPQLPAPEKPVDAKALLALRAVESLEPEMIDSLMTDAIMEPHQIEHFARLRVALYGPKPAPEVKPENHCPPS
jgi:hypothetical protein